MSTLTLSKPRTRSNAHSQSNAPGNVKTIRGAKFLRLSATQRRQVLKAQALAARTHYLRDGSWREWEVADLTGK